MRTGRIIGLVAVISIVVFSVSASRISTAPYA